MTLLMLLRLGASVLGARRACREWPVVGGPIGPALVSPDAGPAVIGVLHPRIVIPQWLLHADASTRSLLLRHEVEHVRAGDTRVLFGSALLTALFPWNVPMRWMLRRLRLTIEIDCDRRVIDALGSARRYGRALLDASERFATPLPMAASLYESRLQLEARIDAMTRRGRRQPFRGFASVGAVVTIAVVALCGFAPWPALVLQRDATPVRGRSIDSRIVGLATSRPPARSHAAFALPASRSKIERLLPSPVRDSVLATIFAGDSSTELILTERQVTYRFTRQGAERIERGAASNDSLYGAWMNGILDQSIRGAVGGMRMTFAVSDIAAVRYLSGNLQIEFRTSPDSRARPNQNAFTVEGVNEHDGQAFARQFAMLKSPR
jgi:hypothetical protein